MSKTVELYKALLRARSIACMHKMTVFERKIESIITQLQEKLTASDYDELIKNTGNIQGKIAYTQKRDILLKNGKVQQRRL